MTPLVAWWLSRPLVAQPEAVRLPDIRLHPLMERRVVGRQHAAFAGGDGLDRVEGETGHGRVAAITGLTEDSLFVTYLAVMANDPTKSPPIDYAPAPEITTRALAGVRPVSRSALVSAARATTGSPTS